MALKKQTVWLLTMLSLIVVLSVYYVTSPDQIQEEVAFGEDQNEAASGETEQAAGEGDVVVNIAEELETAVNGEATDSVISNLSSNDTFATIRMDLQAARDRIAEENTQVVVSAETSALMKSKAHDENLNLIRLAQNEATLETLIKAKGYSDALVITEEDQVRVIVQADELTKKEANEILHMTFDRFGKGLNVAVTHQNTSK
ncbi:SpoIIIAH-like family protein [bacterium LRH843]|nr:SpoIIIAH-like family protein [bacterium LRH843]